jgi:phosphoglycolate phosphatase-like HAD superfamily hydrolase
MIHAVLREMDLSPEKVVFVGDTLTDIDTGKQAGVDVYALPTGFYSKIELSQKKPKRILNNLKELVHVVEHTSLSRSSSPLPTAGRHRASPEP